VKKGVKGALRMAPVDSQEAFLCGWPYWITVASADHCVEARSESIFRSWARLLDVDIG
jgi:hypothetical protein